MLFYFDNALSGFIIQTYKRQKGSKRHKLLIVHENFIVRAFVINYTYYKKNSLISHIKQNNCFNDQTS
jgi:hypothetical protein